MFKKYPSLKQYTDEKEIQWWLNRYPQLKNEDFYIFEKLHGMNIQFLFEPFQLMKIYRRQGKIKTTDSCYFLVERVLNYYKTELKTIQRYVDTERISLHLYGEIIDPTLNNKIYYGQRTKIKVFDIFYNEGWLTFNEYFNLFAGILGDILLQPISKCSLTEAFNFDCNLPSTINKETLTGKPNIMEGVVIKPVNVYESTQGSLFYIKKKNKQFGEKFHTIKPKLDGSIQEWHKEFLSYINENRILSTLSKSDQNFGDYIREIIADAKVDFFADNPDFPIEGKKDLKYIFNVGKYIVPILKKYM